jgi:hypothetical protein
MLWFTKQERAVVVAIEQQDFRRFGTVELNFGGEMLGYDEAVIEQCRLHLNDWCQGHENGLSQMAFNHIITTDITGIKKVMNWMIQNGWKEI